MYHGPVSSCLLFPSVFQCPCQTPCLFLPARAPQFPATRRCPATAAWQPFALQGYKCQRISGTTPLIASVMPELKRARCVIQLCGFVTATVLAEVCGTELSPVLVPGLPAVTVLVDSEGFPTAQEVYAKATQSLDAGTRDDGEWGIPEVPGWDAVLAQSSDEELGSGPVDELLESDWHPPGTNCLGSCKNAAGWCSWCGSGGACCQLGSKRDPAECRGFGGKSGHECVRIPAQANAKCGGQFWKGATSCGRASSVLPMQAGSDIAAPLFPAGKTKHNAIFSRHADPQPTSRVLVAGCPAEQWRNYLGLTGSWHGTWQRYAADKAAVLWRLGPSFCAVCAPTPAADGLSVRHFNRYEEGKQPPGRTGRLLEDGLFEIDFGQFDQSNFFTPFGPASKAVYGSGCAVLAPASLAASGSPGSLLAIEMMLASPSSTSVLAQARQRRRLVAMYRAGDSAAELESVTTIVEQEGGVAVSVDSNAENFKPELGWYNLPGGIVAQIPPTLPLRIGGTELSMLWQYREADNGPSDSDSVSAQFSEGLLASVFQGSPKGPERKCTNKTSDNNLGILDWYFTCCVALHHTGTVVLLRSASLAQALLGSAEHGMLLKQRLRRPRAEVNLRHPTLPGSRWQQRCTGIQTRRRQRHTALGCALAALALLHASLAVSACFAGATGSYVRPFQFGSSSRPAMRRRSGHEDLEPMEGLPTIQQEKPIPKPPLSSLWERWGLLGLTVGLVIVLGGVDLLDDAPGFVDSALQALQSFTGENAQDIEVGLETGVVAAGSSLGMAAMADVSLGTAALTEAASLVDLAAAEEAAGSATAAGLALTSAGRVAVAEAVAECAVCVSGGVALAGGLGALGSLAGLIVEGTKEAKEKEPRTASKGRRGYIVPSASLTPGTIRSPEGSEVQFDERPMSAWHLASTNFLSEWRMLVQAARFGNAAPHRQIPSFVESLILSNEAVAVREQAREAVPTPAPVRLAYDVLCWFIDEVFEDRPIQRFWFLETVARMPYFAYSSVLHLYETVGWWRSPELRAVHAAQEDNELHHLLIMESLGGDQRWLDRFFAQHGAIAYYWLLFIFFVVDPKWSYNFSRLIEAHAVDTYAEFADANEEQLRSIPPPPIAVEYYQSSEIAGFYLFDKFQTARSKDTTPRRPPCSTLLDVFRNIRDDEEQHVLTMQGCEDWVAGGPPPIPIGFNRLSREEYEGKVTATADGREAWKIWGDAVNQAARAVGRQRAAEVAQSSSTGDRNPTA
ncbi:unnamed protein product [Polarella glacialis]|uniref:Ubiquinol oxidase n=2 Tax=Polarella glacialis TaxID=89957 RepID=A0A813L5D8_POLGL|nr:unnamed protein product [Polarella glacialis]